MCFWHILWGRLWNLQSLRVHWNNTTGTTSTVNGMCVLGLLACHEHSLGHASGINSKYGIYTWLTDLTKK